MIKPYPDGVDGIWLAKDQVGQVAAFVTAGQGPIPAEYLENSCLGVDIAEDAIESLSPTTSAKMDIQDAPPDAFLPLAERGFFVFDWQDVHRIGSERRNSYDLVARPDTPILAENLPERLRDAVGRVTFKTIIFQTVGNIDVEASFPCCVPSRAE